MVVVYAEVVFSTAAGFPPAVFVSGPYAVSGVFWQAFVSDRPETRLLQAHSSEDSQNWGYLLSYTVHNELARQMCRESPTCRTAQIGIISLLGGFSGSNSGEASCARPLNK